MDGMVHTGERSINVVTTSKPKMLRGLSHNGTGAGTGSQTSPVMDSPHSRRTESPSPVLGNRAERGKPGWLLLERAGSRKAHQRRGGSRGGKKPKPPCHGRETDGAITRRASKPTSLRCGWPRALDEPLQGARPRTAEPAAGAVAHLVTDGHAIPWKKVKEHGRRLPARLVQATQAGQWPQVHAWPSLLTPSLRGQALAGRRGPEPPGTHTPGVDPVTWQDPDRPGLALHPMPPRGETALPRRRVASPTPHGQQRPLGSPLSPASGLSGARGLGIVLAEPVGRRSLPWAQTASLDDGDLRGTVSLRPQSRCSGPPPAPPGR
jgi:hypothetical protein